MSKKPPPKLSRGLSMAQFMSVVDTSQLASIQSLWNQLDSNGKGLVSANDLIEVMKSVNVDASFDEVSEMIKELDSDGDGKISFRDFYKGVMKKQGNEKSSPSVSRSSSPSLPSSSSSRPSSPSPSSLLSSSSSSSSPSSTTASSSFLSPPQSKLSSSSAPSLSPKPIHSSTSSSSSSSPVTARYYPSHNQFTSPAPKIQINNNSNNNKESTSSPKVEKKLIERSASPTPKFIRSPSVVQFVKKLTGPQLSEMQTLFNHYDHDKDGRINRSSVSAIVSDINPDINKEDIKELLGTIDADRDGQVNFKEFIDGIVMVYRTNKKQAEKVAQEAHAEETPAPPTKKSLKETIAKLQEDITSKDATIEQLRKQVSELQRENAKLKGVK